MPFKLRIVYIPCSRFSYLCSPASFVRDAPSLLLRPPCLLLSDPCSCVAPFLCTGIHCLPPLIILGAHFVVKFIYPFSALIQISVLLSPVFIGSILLQIPVLRESYCINEDLSFLQIIFLSQESLCPLISENSWVLITSRLNLVNIWVTVFIFPWLCALQRIRI